MKRVAIYARVSTNGQSVNNQLRELRQVAKRQGWKVVAEFMDRGVSGAKARAHRPQFDKLCQAATRREIDLIMSWSVDRFRRYYSLQGEAVWIERKSQAGSFWPSDAAATWRLISS